jgi:ribonuclease P protein component
MLAKEKRIRSTRDFKKVYQKGSFFFQKSFNINYLKNKTNFTRLGFVVGKKVSSKAVIRNQIKRKFRESARVLYDDLPKGYDIIINIKKEALNIKQKELEAEIRNSIQKIGKNEKNNSSYN